MVDINFIHISLKIDSFIMFSSFFFLRKKKKEAKKVRHEQRSHYRIQMNLMCNCISDEGGPLGIGLQELISNHLHRRWTKAIVVSTGGKGPASTGSGDRQEEE
jgi:hypothetical protein